MDTIIAILTLVCTSFAVPGENASPGLSLADAYLGGCAGEGCVGGLATGLGIVLIAATTTTTDTTIPWNPFDPGAYVNIPVFNVNHYAYVTAVTIAGVGVILGPAAGVYWRGGRLGEDGSFWAASAGSVVGFLAGGLAGVVTHTVTQAMTPPCQWERSLPSWRHRSAPPSATT